MCYKIRIDVLVSITSNIAWKHDGLNIRYIVLQKIKYNECGNWTPIHSLLDTWTKLPFDYHDIDLLDLDLYHYHRNSILSQNCHGFKSQL